MAEAIKAQVWVMGAKIGQRVYHVMYAAFKVNSSKINDTGTLPRNIQGEKRPKLIMSSCINIDINYSWATASDQFCIYFK